MKWKRVVHEKEYPYETFDFSSPRISVTSNVLNEVSMHDVSGIIREVRSCIENGVELEGIVEFRNQNGRRIWVHDNCTAEYRQQAMQEGATLEGLKEVDRITVMFPEDY